MTARPRILITGFGPFPGMRFNPSARLAQQVGRLAARLTSAVHVQVFAVTYADIDTRLPDLLATLEPDIVLMFGVASRARTLRIETRARNRVRPTLPDAARRRPVSAVISPGRTSSQWLGISAVRLALAARRAGVPAHLSQDAGGYLCNYAFWRAREWELQAPRRRAVFVHIPPLRRLAPSQQARLARAGAAILREIVVSWRR